MGANASFPASTNGKVTLATSRRSFIAGRKLCAAAALGLCLSGRGSSAQFAPIVSYKSSRQELASHIRSALAPLYDFRKPIEKVRDHVVDRLALAA
jgi:hypothetical protein